ncbi:hypothetical protein GCM10009731_09370 [Streptomyces globosus]
MGLPAGGGGTVKPLAAYPASFSYWQHVVPRCRGCGARALPLGGPEGGVLVHEADCPQARPGDVVLRPDARR